MPGPEIPFDPSTFQPPNPEFTGGPINWAPMIPWEILKICPAASWVETGTPGTATWDSHAFIECPDGRRWHPRPDKGIWELSHPETRGRNVRAPNEPEPGPSDPLTDDPDLLEGDSDVLLGGDGTDLLIGSSEGSTMAGDTSAGVRDAELRSILEDWEAGGGRPPADDADTLGSLDTDRDPGDAFPDGPEDRFTDFGHRAGAELSSDDPVDPINVGVDATPTPRNPWYRTPAGLGALAAGFIVGVLAILLWPRGGNDETVAAPSTTAAVTTTTARVDPTPASAATSTTASTTSTSTTSTSTTSTTVVVDPLAGLPGGVVTTGEALGMSPDALRGLFDGLRSGRDLPWQNSGTNPPVQNPAPGLEAAGLYLIGIERADGLVPYFLAMAILDDAWRDLQRPGSGNQIGIGVAPSDRVSPGGLGGYGADGWTELHFLEDGYLAFRPGEGFAPADGGIGFRDGRVATFLVPALDCLRGPGDFCTVAITNFLRDTPPGAEPADGDPTAYQFLSTELDKSFFDPILDRIVADDAPPTVVLTPPDDGSSIIEGSPISIVVDATDDIAVRSVELFVDGITDTVSFRSLGG